jgi:hypothetical protein
MNRPFTTVVLGVLFGCQGVSRVSHRAAGDAGETGGSGNAGGGTTGTGGGGDAGSEPTGGTSGNAGEARDCPLGARRCSASGDAVEVCNVTAPDFVPVEICPPWAPFCICPDEPCTNAFCGTCGAEFTSKFQVCATERDACLEDPGCAGCLGAGGEDCYEGGLWPAYMFCACANIDMTEHPDVLECCYGWCYSEGVACSTSDTGARCCPGLTCRNGICAL